jgi:hypothetical protein
MSDERLGARERRALPDFIAQLKDRWSRERAPDFHTRIRIARNTPGSHVARLPRLF